MLSTYDSINKVWSGASVEPIYNYKCSLGQILFHQLMNFANKVIQIDDTNKTSVTGQQALTWGIRIAQHLKKMQLDHNDVIGISATNTTYVMPVALGCLFNCTPFHAVNPMLDEDTIAHCFGLTKPKIIFCSGSEYEKIKKATQSYRPLIYTVFQHIVNVPNVLDLLEETEAEKCYKPEKLTLEGGKQTVAILCSSGTTGKPKAVCLSSSLLLTNEWFNINDSVFYISSGIDWATGVYFFVGSCLRGYTRIIHHGSFEVNHFLDLVAKYNITSAFLSPFYVSALIQHPRTTRDTLSPLRTITYGGSTLTDASSRKLAELCGDVIKPCFIYGSTEMFFIASSMGNDKPKSIGKLSNGLRLAIVDEIGQRLAHNEVGEIVLQNPNPWIGYYGNRSESEKAVDSEGWFHTGDVGYMDEDNDLFIVDRKKEILKYKGLHYWPREIEDVIVELPSVRDVCVVSVFDDTIGDLAGALLVKAEGSTLTSQQVIDHVRECLKAPHKQLNAGVYFVDRLPQNQNGKLLKKEAKEILQQLVERGNDGN